MKKQLINSTIFLAVFAFGSITSPLVNSATAQSGPRAMVIPGPGSVTSSNYWNGQHGVCDIKVGKYVDNKYGDIHTTTEGKHFVITLGGDSYDCVSTPKLAPVQDFEKFELDTRPTRGLDPTTAKQ